MRDETIIHLLRNKSVLDASFALAMVLPAPPAEGTELEMDALGTLRRVTVVPESPYDPENERLRA